MPRHPFDVEGGGEQLLALGRVDSIEAGVGGRRRGNPHVHFRRAGGANHLDDLGRGGAAHDGIVHQDHALALDRGTVRVVLQFHAEVANLLRRLDEGASHVVVAHDADLEGDARPLGIADGRRHPGIRDRNHHIGVDMALARKLGADALARLVDALAFDHGIGPGEIDVLEDAEPPLDRGEGAQGMHARGVQHHHLAGLDVAHEIRADNVERAGFRGDDMAVAQPPEDQRAHAQGIAHPDDAGIRERHQGIGAFDPQQRVDHAVEHGARVGGRCQVDDHFGVGGRLEQRAALDQFAAQPAGVGQVAVVGECESAEAELREQRLHVAHDGVAGGRIAHMPDRGMAGQARDHLFTGEDVADVALVPVRVKLLAVEAHQPGGFLAAVLQGVQAQGRAGRGVVVAVDAENAAFFMQLVVVEGCRHGSKGVVMALPIVREVCAKDLFEAGAITDFAETGCPSPSGWRCYTPIDRLAQPILAPARPNHRK